MKALIFSFKRLLVTPWFSVFLSSVFCINLLLITIISFPLIYVKRQLYRRIFPNHFLIVYTILTRPVANQIEMSQS